MYYYPFNYWRQMIYFDNSSYYILDYKQGDVNGDGYADGVYAVGGRPSGEESSFADNITLAILDGKTGQYTKVPLKTNSGYKPTVFLGDFNGDGVNDVLVSIDSGGSGGFTYNYIYSLYRNQAKLLFDYERFNEEYNYEVNYRNEYKVEVVSKSLNMIYVIDISRKDQRYLMEIYDEQGKLREPVKGDVPGLVGVYPIDLDRDGVFELLAVQRIIGRYNADTIGFVQTYLKWNGTIFTAFKQYVDIPGYNLNGRNL